MVAVTTAAATTAAITASRIGANAGARWSASLFDVLFYAVA